LGSGVTGWAKKGGAMKKRNVAALIAAVLALIPWAAMADQKAQVQASLRYGCSAQVFEAFETERIPAFTEASGISVAAYICSSGEAVNRLMTCDSDIASTALKLTYPPLEQGYTKTVFAIDPLAVIVHALCPVTDLSEDQLERIFSRAISNWRELGGPDQPILLIVPENNTAAYVNFQRQVMRRSDIVYDLMTFTSTQVVDAVERFPWSISFITQGAVAGEAGVKTIRVNGLSTTDKNYPYYQEFSFITRGRPVGAAKAFIDFTLSTKGIEMIRSRGMTAVLPRK